MLSAERFPEREDLVSQDPQRKDVRAPVDRLSPDLLRGEIRRRPQRDAGLGEVRLGLEGLGDSEVHDLDRTVFQDPHVGRLDVPVDDPGRVGVGEAVRDRDQDFDLAENRQRLRAFDFLVEVFTREELLDDVGDPVFDSEVVNGRDVSVVEVAGKLRLPEEAALDLFVVQLARLDGDRALDVRVPTAVNSAEAAGTDLSGDFVLADFLGQLFFFDHGG